MSRQPEIVRAETPGLNRTERATVSMCAKTLEIRAEVADTVTVSAPFARVVARYLRRMLEGDR